MSEENLYTFENPEFRKTFWHTSSHVMAQAVKRLWPEVQLAIGPAIDEGWYYDFDAPFSLHLAKPTVFSSLSSTYPCTTSCRVPLTDTQNCAIIYALKAARKTCAKVRFPERKPYGARLLYPCFLRYHF